MMTEPLVEAVAAQAAAHHNRICMMLEEEKCLRIFAEEALHKERISWLQAEEHLTQARKSIFILKEVTCLS